MRRREFETLAREFFGQFFVNESGVSDHAHQKAMFGVVAFLVTPGFLIPLQLAGAFELAYARFPQMVEPMTELLSTVFLVYGIVVVGVVAALVWDGLAFDRRDAMVIGPLPVAGPTVVGAKLAAMAALLLILMTSINVITAVPFAAIASSHKPLTAFLRHLIAHVVATSCAAVFMFCALVTIRALLSLLRAGQAGLASLMRFGLVSGLLCFTVLTPTALTVTFTRVRGHRPAPVFHMAEIPVWSPTNWFLGLYEMIRGTNDGSFSHGGHIAMLATLVAAAAAIAMTFVGYRRQLQIALSAVQSGRHSDAPYGRAVSALARVLAGRSAVARGSAEFFVKTLVRNRAQQTPIAFNSAIGFALLVLGLTRTHATLATLRVPHAIVLSIPLMLAFWTIVGLRTACFVPSEVDAVWLFRVAARDGTGAHRRAACAAFAALTVPPAVVLAAVVTMPLNWTVVARHMVFTTVLIVLLIEAVVTTIDFVPFTQPYRPGHAKVRTLWPVYAVGAFLFTIGAARLERWTWQASNRFVIALLILVAAALAIELAGHWTGRKWSVHSREELADDERDIAVLDIGSVVHRAHVGG